MELNEIEFLFKRREEEIKPKKKQKKNNSTTLKRGEAFYIICQDESDKFNMSEWDFGQCSILQVSEWPKLTRQPQFSRSFIFH